MLSLMYNFNSYYKSCVHMTKISPGVVISGGNNVALLGNWSKLATGCSIAPVCKNYVPAQHFFLKMHTWSNCGIMYGEGP